MYVLEGATLGGRVVSRSIHETLSIDARGAGSFFHAYGTETAPMWRSFVERLNRQPPPFDDIVGAALETFERFERWLLDRGAPAWR
jgi:heme oxygenase